MIRIQTTLYRSRPPLEVADVKKWLMSSGVRQPAAPNAIRLLRDEECLKQRERPNCPLSHLTNTEYLPILVWEEDWSAQGGWPALANSD